MDKLKENGWALDRTNGSHHVFVKDGRRPVSILFHGNRDIGRLAKKSNCQIKHSLAIHFFKTEGNFISLHSREAAPPSLQASGRGDSVQKGG
ncbi:MAG: type II toxin-antitoxin system HicA family toxin [Treponema sp.]|nr:type II toxin-antitoxin system HicA family toxin [Treponema sp.]